MKIREMQESIKGVYTIRYDGSWSSKRNATHCLVEFVDARKKIIDFDIVSRADPKTIEMAKKAGVLKSKDILTWVTSDGKFLGPSNLMEDFLVARMVKKWKDDPNLRGYIHDGDTKTPKYLETPCDYGDLIEMHDPGHMRNTLIRMYKDFPGKTKTRGASQYLKKYFSATCNDQNMNLKQKENHWLKFELYLLTKKSNGTYWNQLTDIPSPVTEDYIMKSRKQSARFNDGSLAMEKFLNSTLDLVRMCSNGNTQTCESFHSIKAKKAPKDRAWKTSWLLRMYLSILDFNYKDDIYDMLDEEFGLEIPAECLKRLNDVSLFCKNQRLKMEEKKAIMQRNRTRNLKRLSNKKDGDGHQYADDVKKKEEGKNDVAKSKKQKANKKKARIILPAVPNAGATSFISCLLQIFAASDLLEELELHSKCYSHQVNEMLSLMKTAVEFLHNYDDVPVDLILEIMKTNCFNPEHENNFNIVLQSLFAPIEKSNKVAAYSIFRLSFWDEYTCPYCGFKRLTNSFANAETIIIDLLEPIQKFNDSIIDVESYFNRKNQSKLATFLCENCKKITNCQSTRKLANCPKYFLFHYYYTDLYSFNNATFKLQTDIRLYGQKYDLFSNVYASSLSVGMHQSCLTIQDEVFRFHDDARSYVVQRDEVRNKKVITQIYKRDDS